MQTYKLSDEVIGRIAQIVQEGMLCGVDVCDIMRQIEMVDIGGQIGLDSSVSLRLSPEYIQRVVAEHKKLADEIAVKKTMKTGHIIEKC